MVIDIHLNNPLGGRVFHTRVTESTMDDARRLRDSGFGHGTIVTADFQTRGRGRFGERKWTSRAGENLLCTILLERRRLAFPPQRLPILIGLAVARVIEHSAGCIARIKWPNDVLVESRKIAGVLCEADGKHALVGIGLNCNQTRFPSCSSSEPRRAPTSMKKLVGRDVSITEVLGLLLHEIASVFEERDWRRHIEARLFGVGAEVVAEISGGKGVGGGRFVVVGLGPDGALVLRDRLGREREIYGGEVTFGDFA